ncbi:MAG: carboxypeptidase-like regulatory domain-containing protein [Kofleriaceae bacterium]
MVVDVGIDLPCPSGVELLTAADDEGIVCGLIIDAESRAPIAGATIILTSNHTQAETAITDETGAFAIRVPAGVYIVTYYVDDAPPAERLDLAVTAGSLTSASAQLSRLHNPPRR